MIGTKSWMYAEVKAKAEHLKAIGEKEVYLDNLVGAPWKFVTSVERGGSHRLDIYTSVWFRALEPAIGIPVRWAFDIELSSANGKGNYEIDVVGCREVLSELRPEMRAKFAAYLLDAAKKVRKQAEEYTSIAFRENESADALEKAVKV